MGTTTNGYRYPEPTDPVAAGADAIKNLALDVDAKAVYVGGDTLSGNFVNGTSPWGGQGGAWQSNGVFQAAKTGGAGSAPSEPLVYLGKGGAAAASGGIYVTFRANSSSSAEPLLNQIGSITQSGGGIAYNGTSDPRLKSGADAATRGIDDAAARARALGATAWRGQWLEDGAPAGETWDFLSSHDVQDVAPYAVTGGRDDVDDDGNPVYQQVNYNALVPLLFAALADALDRIAILEGGTP